jgi:RNA polymerase sigma-70 factor, ECF subfamily
LALSLDEMQLVESFRSGDHEAFESLVRAHQPALFRHAMRRLTDAAAAEDAVQETFTRAYRAMGRLGGDYRLGPWLHQIMANVCIDEANRRRREADKFDRVAIIDARTTGEHPSVENQLGLDHDHTAVVAALHTLPANYQEALSLRFIEGYDYDEVARLSGVSEQNARARVSRARTAMRMALRGVAAVPLFFFAVLRRSDKAAKALVGTNEAATAVAPLTEAAQHVAIMAPQAVPVLSKAAVGIGMLVVATSPTTAPIVLNQIRTEQPAAQVLVVEAPPVGPADGQVVAPAAVAAAPAPTPEAPATASLAVAPAAAPEAPATGGAAATGPAVVSTTVPAAADTPVVPAEPTDGAVADDAAPAPAASTVPAIPESQRTGGVLQVGSLGVVASGPRIDVSGPVNLVVGDENVAGVLNGRLRLADSPDGQGRERLEGSFSIVLVDGRTIDLRLAGFATPGADQATDASRNIEGLFRVASDTVALSTSGAFSGALGATALALTLAP